MKTKKSGWNIAITCILLIILAIAGSYAVLQAVALGILSQQLLMIGIMVTICLFLLLSILLLWTQHKNGWKWVVRVIVIVICACLFGAGTLVGQVSSVISRVSTNQGSDAESENQLGNTDLIGDTTKLSSKLAVSLTTYALAESGITTPDQLTGHRVGVISGLDKEGTEQALAQLREKGAQIDPIEYDSIFTLADGLMQKTLDAIVLPESYHKDLLDAANDYNKYNALTTFSNVVDSYTYYTDLPEEMKNPADPVENIKKDPFVVLISGNDSYGNLSGGNRSDANMLVVINPTTHQILLVSIPRDAYLPVACKSSSNQACLYAQGQADKLTHTGIYGVGSTEATLENFLGIPINYTVLLNFSSLLNIVDAVGGIDVFVDEGKEVEIFDSNGTAGVQAGWNHLDGQRTLGFVRERHSYQDGDNQRVKNQQAAVEGIINALKSPASILKYPAVLDVLPTAVSTNMSSEQIREFLSLELEEFPDWKITAIAIAGQPQMSFSPALGQEASVSVITEDQKQMAVDAITKVLHGEVYTPAADTHSSTTDGQSSQTEDHSQTETPAAQTDESYYYSEEYYPDGSYYYDGTYGY